MRISPVDLGIILTRFDGRQLDHTPSSFKQFCLNFFTKNVVPSYHVDVPVDSTVIQQTYDTYYKRKGSSFSAYIYYNLLKTMQDEIFDCLRYRFINDEWYVFDNLPLFISVKIDDPMIQQVGFFIENVARLSWPEFVNAYSEGIRVARQSKMDQIAPNREWYFVCHQMTTLPLDFSSYSPSQKHNDFNAHSPWFVVSQRQCIEGKINFTLSLTVSHASSLPSELSLFLKAFKQSMLEVPERQQLTQYFK